MRSGTNCTITSGEVYSWAQSWLVQAKLVKDHGWRCTRRGNRGSRLAGGSPVDFHLRRLPRSGSCPVRSSSHDGVGGRSAQDVPRIGTPSERGPGRPSPASHDTPSVGHRDRPAPQPLLRAAAEEPQRNLLRSAETGDHEISRLCLGLYRGARPALYRGPDLGATPRVAGHRAAAIAGADPRNRAENQAFLAGSGIFQSAGGGILAGRKPAVLDARKIRGASPRKVAN